MKKFLCLIILTLLCGCGQRYQKLDRELALLESGLESKRPYDELEKQMVNVRAEVSIVDASRFDKETLFVWNALDDEFKAMRDYRDPKRLQFYCQQLRKYLKEHRQN